MRILQLSSARTRGGGERHFVDLVGALAARGHEVHVALAPGTPLSAALKHLPAPHIITLPLRNALDLPSARALARFVRANEIEIVHAHLGRDYPLAAFAAARGRARLVITRHVPFQLSRLHRFVLARVARVIAVSGPVAAGLRAQKIFPADKIAVVPNGIDLAQSAALDPAAARAEWRARLSVPADALLVGTVGDLSPVKGPDIFVRAAAHAVAHAACAATFIVAGEDHTDDQRMRRQLADLIATHKLKERVRMLGRVDELAPFLTALDVYVSASRAEAFGLAMVEAMACGVPVVATATDGAREIVEDGVTGRLVPVGAVEALADAVVALLADADRRAAMGKAARAAAYARFGLARMVDATEQIYREVLD